MKDRLLVTQRVLAIKDGVKKEQNDLIIFANAKMLMSNLQFSKPPHTKKSVNVTGGKLAIKTTSLIDSY